MNLAIRKFLYKILLLAIILIASVWGLSQIHIHQSLPYEYAGGMLLDKHAIAQHTPSPKLLIVGGSSGSFGVNSNKLEAELKLPVANMSFIAPFGSYFLLDDAIKEVKQGDVVLVTLEYDIETYSTADILLSAADYYPAAKKYIKPESNLIIVVKDIVSHQLSNVRKLFWNTFTSNQNQAANIDDETSVYFRGAFSTKGDIVSHLNNAPKYIDHHLFPKEITNFSAQIEGLNTFIAKAKTKGAEVFYVFPPITQSTYTYGKDNIEAIAGQLRKHAKCTIIGQPKDFVMPDSAFFDSFYHLKAQGRDLRTQKLADFLKEIKQ
jgi:hypothetical protein